MKFTKILNQKTKDNLGTRTPIIAFLGDSVTQGVFEVYQKDDAMQVVFDSCAVYSEKVKQILAMLYPQAPVTVANFGVNGSTAVEGYDRLKKYILPIRPDLLIVCFGLNDSNADEAGITVYQDALRRIFRTAKEAGIETIFMTPNMMNTDSSQVAQGDILETLAEVFAKRQMEGVFDTYMDAARGVCEQEDIVLCDCYAIWKNMYEKGVNTTKLLSNGLNHPIREMHNLFAWQLVQAMLN